MVHGQISLAQLGKPQPLLLGLYFRLKQLLAPSLVLDMLNYSIRNFDKIQSFAKVPDKLDYSIGSVFRLIRKPRAHLSYLKW